MHDFALVTVGQLGRHEFSGALEWAQGYFELGMYDDALGEIDRLDPGLQESREAYLMRVMILGKMGKWDEALATGDTALKLHPGFAPLYLATANSARFSKPPHTSALHARRVLLHGAAILVEDEPEYYFLRACYLCQMGDITKAKASMRLALLMDSVFRIAAMKEFHLQPIWDSLNALMPTAEDAADYADEKQQAR